MVGAPVILVNRIGETLKFVADSRHYELEPGDNFGYVEGHVPFALAQNALMGSEDYHTLEFRSMVGWKRDGKEQTDCSPISDDDLLAAMECVERFDRQTSGLAPKVQVRPRTPPPRGRSVASNANGNSMAIGSGA